jgi:glycyl-tRNA synthetase alpha chain
MRTFQQIILDLQDYWSWQGCVAATLRHGGRRGTSHTATFLARAGAGAVARGLRAAVAPPEGWPLRRESQPHAALLPVSGRVETLAGEHPRALPRSLEALGFDLKKNDVRFVEDDWENPTLARGVGWEVWLNGMEVTQFTYSSKSAASIATRLPARSPTASSASRCTCRPRKTCSTWSGPSGEESSAATHLSRRLSQNEVEQSTYNFEQANAPKLFELFAF